MTEIRDLGGHFLIFEQNGDPGEGEWEKGRLNIGKGGQEGTRNDGEGEIGASLIIFEILAEADAH